MTSQYSNANHWCILCKTFIQRDAKSIKFHEESRRHQNKVQRKLSLAASKKDRANAPPPAKQEKFAPEPAAPTLPQIALRADEVLGQYSVRGQVYFQGALHEDLLMLKHSSVELTMLDDDGEFAGWISCRVLNYNPYEEEDPYSVSFTLEDEEEPGKLHLGQVSASDLRILGPKSPPVFSTQQWAEITSRREEQVEEEEETPQVEYYKGVALIEDEREEEEVLLRKPQASENDSKKQPIVFKKRSRPK